MANPDIAIGIDLGTTYSCVAVFQNGEVKIIPNELGASTTPSHIHFDEDGYVTVGKAAKEQANLNPESNIFDVKRLIGRSFNDPFLQEDIQLWPFQVIEDNKVPKIRVNGSVYHPEEISAQVLKQLKHNAEAYLRCDVTKAVITVPAYFNDGQRQATKDAGELAGLQVLRILNEPTAAAIAYCHRQPPKEKQNLLIFDLGGGTFDIAVISMEGGTIEVIAVGGDTHLGGEDFDKAVASYCIEEFRTQHGMDLSEGKNSEEEMKRWKTLKFLRRLKNACEQQKISLTAARRVVVSMDAVKEDLDLAVKVSREQFDTLNQPSFQKCISVMDKTLKDARMTAEDIHDVILVGGSSRIPKIQELLTAYFGGRKPSTVMNGDEAIAEGAALLAALITQQNELRTKNDRLLNLNITFRDVVPLPIGITAFNPATNRLEFFPIIDKNTQVPCEGNKKFETRMQNQRIVIRIFEGEERENIGQNHLLGEFSAANLPFNCPQGEPYWVHMKVNEEGILHVTVSYREVIAKDKLQLDAQKGRIRREELLELKLKEIPFNFQ